MSGDVSLNQRLYVGQDVSLGSRLFVSGDVSLNGLVSVPTQGASDNSTKVATTQYVTTALSAFSGAYATFRGDVSINNRLFVGSDASFGGNLFVKSAINLLNNSTIIGTTYVPNSVNATSNSWTANGVNWTTSASSFFGGLPPYGAFNLGYAGGGWAASSPNYTQITDCP